MTLFNFYHKDILIYPGEKDQVNFWTKKWGITVNQLNEAILQTGSIDKREIKNYLVSEGILFSFSKFVRYIRRSPF